MNSFYDTELSNVDFMDKVIHDFMNNNNNRAFLDSVINSMEKISSISNQKKSSPRQESLLSSYDKKILNTLEDFFKEQKSKSLDMKELRKVFVILWGKVNNVNFITYFNNPFWRLENNLRTPLLQLIRENNYYLARSLENNHVYLIPNGFKFTTKLPNHFEKMEY